METDETRTSDQNQNQGGGAETLRTVEQRVERDGGGHQEAGDALPPAAAIREGKP